MRMINHGRIVMPCQKLAKFAHWLRSGGPIFISSLVILFVKLILTRSKQIPSFSETEIVMGTYVLVRSETGNSFSAQPS